MPGSTGLTRVQLADLIEDRGDAVLRMIVTALREKAPAGDPAKAPSDVVGTQGRWRKVGATPPYDHPWPEVHEHYAPMDIWEGTDDRGLVRFAFGKPAERMALYGKDGRGW